MCFLFSGGGGVIPAESRQVVLADARRDRQGERGEASGIYCSGSDPVELGFCSIKLISGCVSPSDCLQSVFGDGENTKVRVAELEEEVQTLKKVNKDLFEFSSQLLTKPT
ncbi:hypothetical protein ILYODFUR_034611 [Ilyodon furcidens]|uniref:WD repeat-containing protein 18 C-terminal domain-containing protein n=1 Tax=Ilyodon furcidens TaxID=33524 RepID=A0ABV0UXS0_9TELE